MGEFRMPSLGADMDVGTIVEWLVGPGDRVSRGQIVAVVDTAKAAIEIEAFQDGVLQEILVRPGVRVPVGTPLAIIGAPGSSSEPAESPGAPGSSEPGESPGAPSSSKRGEPPAHPLATPPVRQLARQLGVPLDEVAGTGPHGRVTHDDLVRAAAAMPAEPAAAREDRRDVSHGSQAPASPTAGARGRLAPGSGPADRPRVTPHARRIAAQRGIDLGAVVGSGVSGAVLAADVERSRAGVPPSTSPSSSADRKAAMRTAIANLMARSNAEIPHYYVAQTMDLGPGLAWVRAQNADLPPARRLLPAVLFLRATVKAALAVPELNGHWVDGAHHPADRVDLGVAVATRGGGLVTPAIPDAGPLGLDVLMSRLADLVARARRGKLKQAEMAGGSITVSNLGESGADALYGVIFPPQVALVGIGGIVERPWAVNGMLTVRPTATVVLAADHRASDGRTASRFLATFADSLAHPEEL